MLPGASLAISKESSVVTTVPVELTLQLRDPLLLRRLLVVWFGPFLRSA